MVKFEEQNAGVYLLKVPFSGLWTGVILIIGQENCLIDSGFGDSSVYDYIVPALQEMGMDLHSIHWLLNTHSHADHIGGHARLRKVENIKVAAHWSSAPKLADPVRYAIETRTKFPAHSPPPQVYLQGVKTDRILEDGDVVADRLQLIYTPGHDSDCVCWYDLQTGTLITGDSLQGNGTQMQGIGFYKNMRDYLYSLQKLQQLPIAHILCGHDYNAIGWNIRGMNAVSAALSCCRDWVERYHEFILRRYRAGVTDPVELAVELIRTHGCAMPNKLFLALYTVTQHLDQIAVSNSNHLGGFHNE